MPKTYGPASQRQIELTKHQLNPDSGFTTIIQNSWYHHIKLNGKTYMNACVILADIVGWMLAVKVDDESNNSFSGYERKIKHKKYRKSNRQFRILFGFSQKVVETSLKLLIDLKLIETELTTEYWDGLAHPNTRSIDIISENINKITYKIPQLRGGIPLEETPVTMGLPLEETPSPPSGDTYHSTYHTINAGNKNQLPTYTVSPKRTRKKSSNLPQSKSRTKNKHHSKVKDSFKQKKDKPSIKPTARTNHIMAFWNNQSEEHGTCHQINGKTPSKTHQQIHTMFKQLRNGTFFKKNKVINCPPEYLEKKWTDDELLEVIKKFNQFHDPNNEPLNGSYSAKKIGLHTFIRNEHSPNGPFSRMLDVVQRKIKLKFETQLKTKKEEEYYDKFTNCFLNLFNQSKLTLNNKKLIARLVKEIKNNVGPERGRIDVGPLGESRVFDWKGVALSYLDYLTGTDEMVQHPPKVRSKNITNFLPQEGKLFWDLFLKDYKQFYGVDFMTGERV